MNVMSMKSVTGERPGPLNLDRTNSESRVLGRLWRLLRSAGLMAMAATVGLTAAACGSTDGTEEDFEIGTQGQALQTTQFRPWMGELYDRPLNANTLSYFEGDPAICSRGPGFGYFITVRDVNDGFYYVKRWYRQENPTWKKFAPNVPNAKRFVSSPTCTMQYPYPDADPNTPAAPRFLLAGKTTDNRIAVVAGHLPDFTSQDPAPNPVWDGPWVDLDSTQYTGLNGLNGLPALAAGADNAVVTFFNGNRIYAYSQELPYAPGGWGNRISGPLLPSGVTALGGVPAITYIAGSTNEFLVMVRAQTSQGPRAYYIFFNGTSFGNWQAVAFVPYPIESDLSIEYDSEYNALTVYFRTGNQIMQTSVPSPQTIGLYPFYPIHNGTSETVVLGAPRAIYGGSVEGIRAVAVRGHTPATSDAYRGFLLTESIGAPSPW